jgi:bifunctional NMN adenylyltransferase/nudix hydrolase
MDRTSDADATALRDVYFGHAGASLDAALGALVSQAPASTLAFMRAWAELPFFGALATEWEMLRAYKE